MGFEPVLDGLGLVGGEVEDVAEAAAGVGDCGEDFFWLGTVVGEGVGEVRSGFDLGCAYGCDVRAAGGEHWVEDAVVAVSVGGVGAREAVDGVDAGVVVAGDAVVAAGDEEAGAHEAEFEVFVALSLHVGRC